LTNPGPYIGRFFELTGPRSQDMNGVAEEYARALSRRFRTWASRGRRGPSKCLHAPISDLRR
jgi:hypothetical protein